jgi:hypothetical protein
VVDRDERDEQTDGRERRLDEKRPRHVPRRDRERQAVDEALVRRLDRIVDQALRQ